MAVKPVVYYDGKVGIPSGRGKHENRPVNNGLSFAALVQAREPGGRAIVNRSFFMR